MPANDTPLDHRPLDAPLANAASTGPERGRSALPLLLLLAAVLTAAWPALSAELVYDDLRVIRQNPRITSLSNWPAAFSATYWEFLEPEVAERIGYWRPLATLAHTFVYVLSNGATWAFHAASIAVHLVAVAAAYRLARRLTGREGAAFFGALLFGLHPINVETWAWVSALNGALAGLFSLLALDAWVAWRRTESAARPPWRAGLFFALALLSKETAVAVLPMAAALELADRSRPRLRTWLPLLAVFGGYWLARVAVFGSLGAGLDRVTTDFGPDVDAVRLLRLRVELLGGGLVQTLVPDPAVFRPFRPVIGTTDPIFLRDFAVLGAALVWAIVAWRARACHTFIALAFALAALAPIALRVASLGSFPLADRFLYIGSFGTALLVAHVVTARLPRSVAFAGLGALALVAGWRAHERAGTWANERALFEAAVEEGPESPYVHWGLGRVHLARFQRSRDPQDLMVAAAAFETSADLLERALAGDSTIFATRQDAEQTNVGLGWCYLFEAEVAGSSYATAQSIFELALEGSPTSESAATGLGVALHAQHKLDEAQEAYERALEQNPRFVEAHHNLAQLHLDRREWAQAEEHLRKALALRADHFEDVVLLARAQYEGGDTVAAKATAEHARALNPESPEPLEILAVIAGSSGDGATAMRHLDAALRLDPNYGRVHYLRANEFLRRRDGASAITSLRRACELMPRDFPAHHDLGALLLSQGAVDAALPFLTRAYEECRDDARLELLRRSFEGLPLTSAQAPLAWANADNRRGAKTWIMTWADRAVEADPKHVEARLFRATHRERRGNTEGAIEDLRQATAGKDAFHPLVELARMLTDAGETEEARDALTRALAVEPPHSWEPSLREASRSRAERMLRELGGE